MEQPQIYISSLDFINIISLGKGANKGTLNPNQIMKEYYD
jgi:hypothetical protein